MERERRSMVAGLVERGVIETPEVERAMLKVPRHLFVPQDLRHLAYRDSPLPIASGQTISAPHMVAMMAEALVLEKGHKVLEVGAGSGYNAAVMAELVGEGGLIISIERHPELARAASQALAEAGYGQVRVVEGDGSMGYPDEAPFDRISVTCGAPKVPNSLLEQLKDGGVMVIPVGGLDHQSLMRVRKLGGRTITDDLGPVLFVPLVGEKGHPQS